MHVRGTASETTGGAAWQRGAPFSGKVRPAAFGNSLPRGPRLAAKAARQLDLPPAASMGTGLISREARDVLSYRYATSPESSYTGHSTTKGPCSGGLLAL